MNALLTENDKIWVGYEEAGVKLFNYKGEEVRNLSLSYSNDKKNRDNIRTIKKDTYGRVWIGTYQGLFMYDGETTLRFNSDEYPGLIKNSIFEIFEDMQGGIWLGTWHGGVVLGHLAAPAVHARTQLA